LDKKRSLAERKAGSVMSSEYGEEEDRGDQQENEQQRHPDDFQNDHGIPPEYRDRYVLKNQLRPGQASRAYFPMNNIRKTRTRSTRK
jgi:hypothetical protein